METNIAAITESLQPLFERAEKEGLWFSNSHYGVWFSPKELKAEQDGGKFLWGAPNWELRDPAEKLMLLKRAALDAEQAVINFQKRMKEATA